MTAHSYSQPPTDEVDPQVPLTHVMLAREETPRLLAWALLRYWMTSRVYLVQVGILLAVTLVLALLLRSVASAVVVGAVLVLTPVLLSVRCTRSARAYAPPGFTLGIGLGATHLAVRNAVATTVTPYASWQSVHRRGEVVVLRTRRSGVLPLPAELVPALEQLTALVKAAAGEQLLRSDGADAPALPHAYECTRATRGLLARSAVVRQLLNPRMLALGAVDLLLLASPIFLRGSSWLWAAFPAVVTLVLVGVAWWGDWRRSRPARVRAWSSAQGRGTTPSCSRTRPGGRPSPTGASTGCT
ncbi:MAG: hypothetical protein ABJA74_00155 [Lapillicoccus sp.]